VFQIQEKEVSYTLRQTCFLRTSNGWLQSFEHEGGTDCRHVSEKGDMNGDSA
jgi:hypothetical protein